MTPAHCPSAPQKPKLLDLLRDALRSRHYSRRTAQSYGHWVKRFIFFHHVRHPAEMAEPEINAFLTHLAVKEKVSASTQNQALSALLFLYRHVLRRELGDLGDVIRARRPHPLPVVMTRDEVKAVRGDLRGDKWLMASLWRWQWVFPQESRWRNPSTGEEGRHHIDASLVQRAVKDAVRRAGIVRRATCHTFRPLVCDPCPGGWVGHSHRAGASRPSGHPHHHDLHPCPEPGAGGLS